MNQITSDESTYTFAEHASLFSDQKIFNLFAYGVYNPSLDLNEKQKRKMQLLTLLSLCQDSKKLSLQEIQQKCYLNDPYQVELLVIEAITKELIKGIIDSKNAQVIIKSAKSRDIHPTMIPKMQDKINAIIKRIQHIKSEI